MQAKTDNDGKLNPNINTKLVTSIGKCAYIIQEYPTSKWVDDAILLMGQCFYEQENYVKALRKFQEYEKYYSSKKLYPLAKLSLAKTYLTMNEYDEAIKQFSAIFNNPKFIEVREEAYFQLVDYYIEEEKYKDGKNTVLALLDSGLKKKSHLKAMFLYAQIEYLNGSYQNAELAFRNFLAENPPKRLRLDAMYYIGKILISTGKYEDALVVFETLEKIEVNVDKLPDIQMNIAICEAYLGNGEKAFKIFEKLIKDNAGKKIVSEINYYWGDIYFTLHNDYEKAEEKFKAISMKHLNEELMNETTKKLKIVQEFIGYKTKQSSSQINQLVEFQFQIAEYYNFDLNQPDSALSMYDNILNQLPQFKHELDSLKNILMTYYHESIPETTEPVSPITIDSTDTTSIILEDSSFTTIVDSIEIVNKTEAFIDSVTIDSLHQDSLSEISIFDTTFSDSVLADSTVVDSAKIEPVIVKIPPKQQLLVRIENLQNIIHEYEKEIIAKTLFMKLWIYHKKTQDTEKASEIINILETEYSTSKYTNAGKKMIHNQSYELIDMKEHNAKEYLEKALGYYFDSVTLEQSHAYIDTILTAFDSTEVYPQALYLKSYLYVTENQDTTSARPYLEKLFTDYPQHQLKNEVTDFFDGTHFIPFEPEEDSIATTDSIYVLSDSTFSQDSLLTVNTTTVKDSNQILIEQDSTHIYPESQDSLEVFKQ